MTDRAQWFADELHALTKTHASAEGDAEKVMRAWRLLTSEVPGIRYPDRMERTSWGDGDGDGDDGDYDDVYWESITLAWASGSGQCVAVDIPLWHGDGFSWRRLKGIDDARYGDTFPYPPPSEVVSEELRAALAELMTEEK